MPDIFMQKGRQRLSIMFSCNAGIVRKQNHMQKNMTGYPSLRFSILINLLGKRALCVLGEGEKEREKGKILFLNII